MTKHAYSIQMYSLRDMTPNDLAGALEAVAKMGYRAVEFAGFFGHAAADVKAMLDHAGLAVSGTHSSFGDLLEKYDETVAYHKALGNRYYIVPGWDLSSQEKLDHFVAHANPLREKLAAEGITLGYHNHAREFRANTDGSVPYEQLIYRTDLMLEVDTYWAYVGMNDPIALLDRLAPRVGFLHIKDGTADGKGKPLGMGEAPVRAVYDWGIAHDVPLVVESETLTPSGAAEAQICIDYLAAQEN